MSPIPKGQPISPSVSETMLEASHALCEALTIAFSSVEKLRGESLNEKAIRYLDHLVVGLERIERVAATMSAPDGGPS